MTPKPEEREMPDEIYIHPTDEDFQPVCYTHPWHKDCVKYIRADLAPAPPSLAVGEADSENCACVGHMSCRFCEALKPKGWVNPHNKSQPQWLPWIKERVIFCLKNGAVYQGWHTGGSWRAYALPGKHIDNDEVDTWCYPATIIQAAQSPQGCGMTKDDVVNLIIKSWTAGTVDNNVLYCVMRAVDELIAANLLTVKGE